MWGKDGPISKPYSPDANSSTEWGEKITSLVHATRTVTTKLADSLHDTCADSWLNPHSASGLLWKSCLGQVTHQPMLLHVVMPAQACPFLLDFTKYLTVRVAEVLLNASPVYGPEYRLSRFATHLAVIHKRALSLPSSKSMIKMLSNIGTSISL